MIQETIISWFSLLFDVLVEKVFNKNKNSVKHDMKECTHNILPILKFETGEGLKTLIIVSYISN